MGACKKDWLDAKSNKALVVPTTIEDMQALLDNDGKMLQNQICLSEIGSDDCFLPYESWTALPAGSEKAVYTWDKDIYAGFPGTDWINVYGKIFIANVALDGINKIVPNSGNSAVWRSVKGIALFHRAFNHFDLSNHFAVPYNTATASSDLGIPLRLSGDINEKIERKSNQVVYDQIVNDLKLAANLLPAANNYPTRPTKASAYGLLAHCYLNMHDYDNALLYADSSLQINNTLIDYNTISPTTSTPFPQLNKETLFFSISRAPSNLRPTYLAVDQSLYDSYGNNDLRKVLFFTQTNGYIRIKGTYNGTAAAPFGGLAIDEMYLIKAECLARKGVAADALKVLNDLLRTRWKSGVYPEYSTANSEEALRIILTERRKELVFRGIRWQDLRRLNTDARFQTTLQRNLNGQLYTLKPNHPNYTLPIPDAEIELSRIQQNPRTQPN